MSTKSFSVLFITGILLLLFTSCAIQRKNPIQKDQLVLYPAPPDTARIQYLTSFSNSADVVGRQSSFSKFIMGEKTAIPIAKPYGVFMHKGKLYVCDSGLGKIVVLDLKKHTFDYLNSSGLGQLKFPINCFIDENDLLYVADGGRRQIVVLDLTGKYITSFGEEEKYKPTDVFVFEDKIWVSNVKNNQIKVYNKDSYELLYAFPDSETGNEDFLYSPTNIFVTEDKVYVSDMGVGNIKTFTHEGKFISSLGSYGKAPGQFVRPKGIAVDKDSNLYVVDASFENVQIFNGDDKLLMFFGGTYKGPGGLWLPTKIMIDYDNLEYFKKFVYEQFDLKYIIIVANQFGPDKINIYGYIEPK